MNLARMMTDKIFIEARDGTRSGPFKTKFGGASLMVFQSELEVAAGDRVIRPLPDGSELAYLVDGISFNNGSRNIPSHFSIRIAEQAATPDAPVPALHAASAGVEPSVRAVDLGLIAASLRTLSQAIEGANFPCDRKDEANKILRTLLDHPVVAALLSEGARKT